jgi:HD-GYP domain-containing protein (c-di-GMP phosphodiesterase class II)
LNSEEWEEIKRHPEISYNILSTVSEYASLAEIILSHHERWDGKGYPRNLKGEDIPLKARIIAVADSYDAMTSERPYHGPMSKEKALEELEKCAGTQFDPEIVKVFIENEVASEVFELCPYNAVKST